jgi:potassium-dependent mechanosensitive channel
MAQEIPLEELQKGVQAVTWQRGLVSALVLLGAILVAKLAGSFVRWAFSKEVRGPAFAFSKLITYGLTFAGAVAALGLLGLPVSSLVLTSSALLVGVGFSLQNVARDLVAGIVILVEQSIRKNDFVSFGGTTGTVQEIGLRATQLFTRDGTVLVVPNNLLITTEVTNQSHPFRPSRVLVELPTDVSESADDARAAILGAAEHHPEVLSEPPPMVRLAAIESVGMRFLLIAWVKEPVTVPRIASDLRFAVSRAFAERGIRFPITTIALDRPNHPERDAGRAEQTEPPPEH